MDIQRPFFARMILPALALAILCGLLSACTGQPRPQITYRYITATPRPVTPLPSPALLGGTAVSLKIYNRFDQDIFVSLDGGFALLVTAGRSGVFQNLSAGEHSIVYCRQPRGVDCAEPLRLTLLSDATWIAGDGAFIPQITPTATETGFPLPVGPESGPIPATGAPGELSAMGVMHVYTATPGPPVLHPQNEATLKALAPTLAAMAPTQTALALTPFPQAAHPTNQWAWMITVHNRYSWSLSVSIDDQYLMTVPANKYLWHVGIRAGLRRFKFCLQDGWCWNKDIQIDKDVVIIISP